jgi:hypothetical protein
VYLSDIFIHLNQVNRKLQARMKVSWVAWTTFKDSIITWRCGYSVSPTGPTRCSQLCAHLLQAINWSMSLNSIETYCI